MLVSDYLVLKELIGSGDERNDVRGGRREEDREGGRFADEEVC
jgi:hypothetical protein